MNITRFFPVHICIRRYHLILFVVCALLITRVSMFSSHEKKWYPYTVVLTFDDGPHPFYTLKLLDILSRYHIRATFFLVGKQIEKYPDLALAIAEEGHEFGNHTYHHYNLTTISPKTIINELKKTQHALNASTGKKMVWFRPPGGKYNDRVIHVAESCGYTMVLWDVEPRDHLPMDPDTLLNNILRNTSDDNIILLHSGIDTTVACLPRLIEALRERGFRFVTVSERIASRQKADF